MNKIALLNDAFRTTFSGGKVMMTSGVSELPDCVKAEALVQVARFKGEIEESLPSRGGKRRELTKEDFSRKGAIFLREKAQFDYLVERPDGADRAKAVIDAMTLIEADYQSLKGMLPKNEYQELDNDVLGRLLRIFNDPALKNANGDIFGRIYEYFLTQFADLKAHDGGEFFTPVSLVQMIVNVIEPDHGTVLDPACGSGGMFVQSAHFIERLKKRAAEQATFYGMEKNPTTIRLAKMNLAVHGLEGKIDKAITYYEDPHELVGKCDFVMAKVLMLDARSVYRKVTRKIYDFSPEQLKDLTSIIWLYRGQGNRFLALVADHLANSVSAAARSIDPTEVLMKELKAAKDKIEPFFNSAAKNERVATAFGEFATTAATLRDDVARFSILSSKLEKAWEAAKRDNATLNAIAEKVANVANASHDLIRQIDLVAKLFLRTVDLAGKELGAKENGDWSSREVKGVTKALDEARQNAVEELKLVRYFYRHAHWLQERFPKAELRDVEGLVKLVSYKELEKNDWSLSAGRYVGVAPEVEDEDFDLEEALREIHIELQDLNSEAADLAGKISKTFGALGI
jgi:type I restriction-modification system DNA methylase subunit